jgi:hypothetical protein
VTDLIRLELTGRTAAAWDAVFDRLTESVNRAVDALSGDAETADGGKESELVSALAEITKGWAKAKLERPSLENERIIAEIAEAYERAKLLKAQRHHQEIENEQARIALLDRKLGTALKWLGLKTHLVKDEHGNTTLVVTKEDLRLLAADLGSVGGLQDR